MKSVLRIGEGYAFSEHKLKHSYKRYFSLLAAATIMCLYAVKQVSAQEAEPAATAVADTKPLQIGDTIPEPFYHTLHHAVDMKTGGDSAIRLIDQRPRLIILDFWAHWCGPCLFSLSKFDTLKMKYPHEDYVVIPVTSDSDTQIERIVDRYHWDLVSVVADSVLKTYFPHQTVPHQVWIKDDKVIAMPNYYYATEENIKKAVAGKQLNVVNKAPSIRFSPSNAAVGEAINNTDILYQTANRTLFGYLNNYQWDRLTYFTRNDSTFLYCVNLPIADLYMGAFQDQLFPPFRYYLPSQPSISWQIDTALKRELTERPPFDLTGDKVAMDRRRNEWRQRNSYGYLLCTPGLISEADARKILQKDLNAYFGYALGIEASIQPSAAMSYAVLRLSGSRDLTQRALTGGDGKQALWQTADSVFYHRYLFGTQLLLYVKRALDKCEAVNLDVPTVINETGFPGDFLASFSVPRLDNCVSLEDIQNALRPYGLTVIVEEKPVPILEIRNRVTTINHKSTKK